MRRPQLFAAVFLFPLLGACAAAPEALAPPLAGLENVDGLIEPAETHFAHLWRVATGGENAEGYWSFAGDRIVFQRRHGEIKCDRIFVTDGAGGWQQVSSGKGTTTCSYFMPGDRSVIFASTQAYHTDCPPPPDRADGYVWALHPEFDLWTRDLETGAERRLTEEWGYDAEATLSPDGTRIVFTSDRSGDIELWTCAVDGSDLRQVTNELGYDGGAFFSHDGKQLVFRATTFVDEGPGGSKVGTREQYVELLAKHKIRPHRLDIYTCDVDGSNRRRVTELDGANWAPYFFPGDRRILFATNHHDTNTPKVEFDLFAIDVDGRNLERITSYKGFDSFPMFSRDGRWLIFASNRGGSEAGETNLYLAQWR